MRSSSLPRRGTARAWYAALALCLGCAVGSARGQEVDRPEAGVQVATALDPDTVWVGERFVLGVTLRTPPGGRIRFPAVLPLDELFEQRGPVEERSDRNGGSVWRAYYSLVSWKAGSWSVPAFEVEYAEPGGGERRVSVVPPELVVRSVLPAETEGLELRDARPFLRVTGWPWWWLAVAAALAAAAYWLWKRRRAARPQSRDPADAAARALQRLEGLKLRWSEGDLSGPQFFDGLEATIREYGDATRDWLPGRTIQELARSNGEVDSLLAEAIEWSRLVRFARLATSEEAPLRAVAASAEWVDRDYRASRAAADSVAEAAASEEGGQRVERSRPGGDRTKSARDGSYGGAEGGGP